MTILGVPVDRAMLFEALCYGTLMFALIVALFLVAP